MANPLPPPPNTTPLVEKDGTPTTPWKRWLALLQSTWATGLSQSFAHCTQSSGQVVPQGVSTVINFDTKVSDADKAVTTGAAWKWTCPTGKAGLYSVSAACGGNYANTLSDGFMSIYVNGTETLRGARFRSSAAGFADHTVSGVLSLEEGDTVQLKIFQTQAVSASVTLESNAVTNWVTVARIPGA